MTAALSPWQSVRVLLRGRPVGLNKGPDPVRPPPRSKIYQWTNKAIEYSLIAILLVFFLAALAAFNLPFSMASSAWRSIDHPAMEKNIRHSSIWFKKVRATVTLQMNMTDQIQDISPPQQMIAVDHVSKAAAQNIDPNASGSAKTLSVTPSAQTDVSGVTFLITAPDPFKEMMREALFIHGGTVIDDPGACASCTRLNWTKGSGWEITAPKSAPDDLKLRLFLIATAHLMSNPAFATPSVVVDPEHLVSSAKPLLKEIFIFSFNMAYVVLAWLLMYSASFLGFSWDRRRSAGHLEYLTATVHPPWVLFTSGLMKSARSALMVFGFFVLLGVLWRLPLDWPLIVSLLIFIPSATVLVGLWGLMATFLFHHRHGRMFARLVLSPVTLLLAWSVRVMIIWGALQASDPLQARVLARSILDNAPSTVAMIVPVMWLISLVLFAIINHRIGPRRQGLRACT